MAQVRTEVDPKRNRLLSSLPADELMRLRPHLEPLRLSHGTIHEAGGPITHVYFPTGCIIGILYTAESGASIEIGMAGAEGVVGTAAYLAAESAPARAVVQNPGAALRLGSKILRQEFARGGAFQDRLLRYAQAFTVQVSQTAVCNRYHSVEQQLCRWLLQSHDRLGSDQLQMTQESIAALLGVRREGITAAALRLQNAGIIKYARGRINILSRKNLESVGCECYRAVKAEFDRLLG